MTCKLFRLTGKVQDVAPAHKNESEYSEDSRAGAMWVRRADARRIPDEPPCGARSLYCGLGDGSRKRVRRQQLER
jgi:hypothetical protein